LEEGPGLSAAIGPASKTSVEDAVEVLHPCSER
jgi:hypothetical protein